MDGATAIDWLVFAAASFAASLVAGLAGFAFGLVAAAVWLHILTPVQTTALIVAFGLLVQGVSVSPASCCCFKNPALGRGAPHRRRRSAQPCGNRSTVVLG